VIPQFADQADFSIHFQPFQLYPDLPGDRPDGFLNKGGNSKGVDKNTFFKELGKTRGRTPEQGKEIRQKLQDAWKAEGLELTFGGGKWGSSFDAQRLISFARKQGREDQMIEEIYTANHVKDMCLSDWSVLVDCANKAGVAGAKEMLNSDKEKDEVHAKILTYYKMGLTSVPCLVLNEKYPMHGAPEPDALVKAFSQLIKTGELPVSGTAAL